MTKLKHIDLNPKKIIIPTSEESKNLIDNFDFSRFNNHPSKKILQHLLLDIKDNGLNVEYLNWHKPEAVYYKWLWTFNAPTNGSQSAKINTHIYNNSIIQIDIKDFIKTCLTPQSKSTHQLNYKLQPLAKILTYYLDNIAKKINIDNELFYNQALANKRELDIKKKKESYPLELGQLLSNFKINDKELLLKLLKYIKTNDGGYKLQKIISFLTRLDQSALSDETIEKAVEIATITDILE